MNGLKYKIAVNCNVDDIHRILDILFKHGYVWDANLRLRKYEDVARNYLSTMKEWGFIRTHFDHDCKMVINRLVHWEWGSILREYQTITLEEFLYDIAGHPRPAVDEKKIVTLEEVTKEFHASQRQTYSSFMERPEEERTQMIDELAAIIDDPLLLSEREREHLHELNLAELNTNPSPTIEATPPPAATDGQVNFMNLVVAERRPRRRSRVRRRRIV